MSELRPRSVCILFLVGILYSQTGQNPDDILKEADRLVILRSWELAEPLFAEAEREFSNRDDRRNTLHAQAGKLRAQLARHSVADMSQRFAEFLEDPLVQHDDRLKLRCLVAKGETDLDLDPALAEQDWDEALTVARSSATNYGRIARRENSPSFPLFKGRRLKPSRD